MIANCKLRKPRRPNSDDPNGVLHVGESFYDCPNAAAAIYARFKLTKEEIAQFEGVSIIGSTLYPDR